MFSFSFKISKSWLATETTKITLGHNELTSGANFSAFRKVLLIDVNVSLSIFSLPLGIVMAGLARIRLSAVCLRPKRPDLYIGGENKAH